MLNSKAGPFLIQFYINFKKGIGKLAYLKVDIGKILGKWPQMIKIPLQGNGMAAIPKSNGNSKKVFQPALGCAQHPKAGRNTQQQF